MLSFYYAIAVAGLVLLLLGVLIKGRLGYYVAVILSLLLVAGYPYLLSYFSPIESLAIMFLLMTVIAFISPLPIQKEHNTEKTSKGDQMIKKRKKSKLKEIDELFGTEEKGKLALRSKAIQDMDKLELSIEEERKASADQLFRQFEKMQKKPITVEDTSSKVELIPDDQVQSGIKTEIPSEAENANTEDTSPTNWSRDELLNKLYELENDDGSSADIPAAAANLESNPEHEIACTLELEPDIEPALELERGIESALELEPGIESTLELESGIESALDLELGIEPTLELEPGIESTLDLEPDIAPPLESDPTISTFLEAAPVVDPMLETEPDFDTYLNECKDKFSNKDISLKDFITGDSNDDSRRIQVGDSGIELMNISASYIFFSDAVHFLANGNRNLGESIFKYICVSSIDSVLSNSSFQILRTLLGGTERTFELNNLVKDMIEKEKLLLELIKKLIGRDENEKQEYCAIARDL